MASRVILAACLAASLSARVAHADDDDAPRPSAADVLFKEGKALMDEGRLEEACRVLAESHRLEPAGGTLLNLASCYERLGRYASAEQALDEAGRLADAAGRPDAREFVDQRLAAVRPNVSVLTITTPRNVEVTVEVDGSVVALEDHTATLRLDPGEHLVVADVIGAPLWRRTVNLEGAGSTFTVEVPAPRPAPRPRVVHVPVPAPDQPVDPLLPIGIAGVVLGGGLLIGGGIAGGFALDAWNDVKETCPESPCDDPEDVSRAGDAQTLGDLSTAFFVAGGVTAAAGIVLLVVDAVTEDDIDVGARGLTIHF
jgi:tetratricopeptide (TPR) repeat protein